MTLELNNNHQVTNEEAPSIEVKPDLLYCPEALLPFAEDINDNNALVYKTKELEIAYGALCHTFTRIANDKEIADKTKKEALKYVHAGLLGISLALVKIYAELRSEPNGPATNAWINENQKIQSIDLDNLYSLHLIPQPPQSVGDALLAPWKAVGVFFKNLFTHPNEIPLVATSQEAINNTGWWRNLFSYISEVNQSLNPFVPGTTTLTKKIAKASPYISFFGIAFHGSNLLINSGEVALQTLNVGATDQAKALKTTARLGSQLKEKGSSLTSDAFWLIAGILGVTVLSGALGTNVGIGLLFGDVVNAVVFSSLDHNVHQKMIQRIENQALNPSLDSEVIALLKRRKKRLELDIQNKAGQFTEQELSKKQTELGHIDAKLANPALSNTELMVLKIQKESLQEQIRHERKQMLLSFGVACGIFICGLAGLTVLSTLGVAFPYVVAAAAILTLTFFVGQKIVGQIMNRNSPSRCLDQFVQPPRKAPLLDKKSASQPTLCQTKVNAPKRFETTANLVAVFGAPGKNNEAISSEIERGVQNIQPPFFDQPAIAAEPPANYNQHHLNSPRMA